MFANKRKNCTQMEYGNVFDRNPNCGAKKWDQLPPNRLTTHLILIEASEFYRTVTAAELSSEDIDLELLDPSNRKKR